MAYREIKDAEVAAFAPLTSRLARRLNNNAIASLQRPTSSAGLNTDGSIVGAPATADVSTGYITVPQCYIGTTGADVVFYCRIYNTYPIISGTSSDHKVVLNSIDSNVENLPAAIGAAAEEFVELTVTVATAGTYDWQANVVHRYIGTTAGTELLSAVLRINNG